MDKSQADQKVRDLFKSRGIQLSHDESILDILTLSGWLTIRELLYEVYDEFCPNKEDISQMFSYDELHDWKTSMSTFDDGPGDPGVSFCVFVGNEYVNIYHPDWGKIDDSTWCILLEKFPGLLKYRLLHM